MTRLVVCALLLPGCFYTAEINQRPSIDITAPGDEVYRGDKGVMLSAVANDPEGQYVSYLWRAYACTDGVGGADCDRDPFDTGALKDFTIDIPVNRADQPLPVRNVRVVLGAKDDHGATAKPEQEHVIVVLDNAPTIVMARDGNFVMTPNRTVRLYATVDDIDDTAQALGQPTWEVFAPGQEPYTLVDAGTLGDPARPYRTTYVKDFTPSATGSWGIRVTASDPLDEQAVGNLPLEIVPPPPPCIAQVAPIVPPAGAALPISDPTLFRVPVVIDDLDVWPPQPDDPVLGTTKFQWSFMGPGAPTHAIVPGATGNTFALDPATFTPGDIVEVRVEIYDRQLTPIPCPDGDATCSTISMQSCIQRQTWRVEVR